MTTMPRAEVKFVDQMIEVRIPVKLGKHGGKKTIIGPSGQPVNGDRNRDHDQVLLKALVRAHSWNRRLMNKDYVTIKDLAKAEGIRVNYMAVILRLIALAPDIQEAILESRHPSHITLADVKEGFPIDWEEQRLMLGFSLQNRSESTQQDSLIY